MSYTISIKRNETGVKTTRGSHCKLGTNYLSGAEFEQLDYNEKQKWCRRSDGQYEREIYGYPEAIEVPDVTSVVVFEQTVSNLDVAGLARFINSEPAK